MPVTRRNFLFSSGLAAAGASLPFPALAAKSTVGAFQPENWNSVRAQFSLSPDYIHLACLFIAPQPRPVREAVEAHRRAIEANPFLTIENGMFGKPEEHMPTRVCKSAAAYAGGKASEYAITSNTTTGLALVYNGLKLKPGQEILTTIHDHYSHHESIRLAAEKQGTTFRRISLFEKSLTASEDEIVGRLVKSVQPNTRVIGITWVHSSSGIRLPVSQIAEAIRGLNRERGETDRVLLVVDGVHGFGAVDQSLPDLGCDFFVSATHKWILAPRGTGIIWAREPAWSQMRPTVPTFNAIAPYEAWQKGEAPKGPTQADWVSPGGFYAYENQWAMPDAFRFQEQIGRKRVAARLAELNGRCKEGLAKMPRVTLHTPLDSRLSAGIISFEVAGMTPEEVVAKLLKRRIIASTSPYVPTYARLSFGIMNTPEEVDVALKAVRELA